VGTAEFDVSAVDVSTLSLHGAVPITQGGGPKLDDVATPVDNTDCACTNERGDGIMDLKMKFSGQDVARAIMTGPHRGVVELTLMGQMLDGTTFLASDCIKFVGGPPEDEDDPIVGMDNYALGAASPNPFNPMTRISYSLADAGPVDLSIYDVNGRLVERLVSGVRDAGKHMIEWNASGLASGIYFYRLKAGEFTQTRKLVLLK
jgi:hypothetical protein